jgi:hypothetical protein
MKSTSSKVILISSLLAVVGMFSIPGAAFADQGGVPNGNSTAAADDVRQDGAHKTDGPGKKGGKGKAKKKKGGKKKE